MNCPQCAKAISANQAYCMHCGTQIPQTTPSAVVTAGTSSSPVAMAVAMQDQARKRALGLSAIVAIAFLLGGAYLTRAAGLWGASASQTDNKALQANGSLPNSRVLAASGSVPNAMTVKTASTGPAVMQQNAEAPEKMPQDVLDWLKHLEKCEAKKVSISGDQIAEVTVLMQKISVLGAGMGLMDPYDQSSDEKGDLEPSGYAKGKIMDLRPQWSALYKFYRSYPPPAECIPIANDFDKAMSEIPGMMGDLGDVLNHVQANPSDALKDMKKLQNTSYGDIDRYFSRCDEKVNQICDKYHMHKWFNIKSDVMAGGVLGKQSLPSGG